MTMLRYDIVHVEESILTVISSQIVLRCLTPHERSELGLFNPHISQQYSDGYAKRAGGLSGICASVC